jgi:hypothetical protein
MKDENINYNTSESIVNNFKVSGFEFESPKINLDLNFLIFLTKFSRFSHHLLPNAIHLERKIFIKMWQLKKSIY